MEAPDPNTLEMLFLDSGRALDPIGEWILAERDAFVSVEIYGTFGRYAIGQLRGSNKVCGSRTIAAPSWIGCARILRSRSTPSASGSAIDALFVRLDRARDTSPLPEEPTGVSELRDFLVAVRRQR